jgi:brefeldin A-resistance guanine nucleotide exchange factor 1
VRENLKNVVLFMASSGYLVSPKQEPSKQKLWVETWKRIDRFLPDLRSDLALEEPDEPEKGGAGEAAEATAGQEQVVKQDAEGTTEGTTEEDTKEDEEAR